MNKLNDIINYNLEEFDIEYRVHATRRMFQRNILEKDIELLLTKGAIIEKYDDDFPLPSILINGTTSDNRPLHLVAGINNIEKIIIIITAYEPDYLKWSNNFTRRIK